MGENLSKNVVSISLADAIHALSRRLYSPGVVFQVGPCRVDVLEGERFRVTYSSGKTELFQLKGG